MVNIYIGNDKVEQFKDEAVDVVSSVLDVSDITKNTGDYSKTFTVPASRSNNKLFKHWYNANIDNGFDARTKIEGRIDIDGIPFKKGKFRLYKVNVKKGVATSYTINFFGNLIDVKETVGKDDLTDLDLSAYDHFYNSDNVKLGLSDVGLFSRDLIYTLQANKRYFYNSNPIIGDFSETQINIAAGGDGTGVTWNDIRPSLRLIKVIEAIEARYTIANGFENPIVFSNDFFGTSEFNDLYLYLSPTDAIPAGGVPQIIDWDSGDDTFMSLVTDIGTYEVSDEPNNEVNFLITVIITPAIGYEDVPYETIIYNEGEEYATGGGVYLTAVNTETETYNLSFGISTINEFRYTARLKQERYESGAVVSQFNTLASENETQSVFEIKTQIPELPIIDLLKGLFNMFKLVVIPQDNGTLYVNTLQSYYNQGTRHDITKYVDNKKLEVQRGEILNEIDIKFSEGETILAEEFRNQNGRGYGDSLVRLKDEFGKLIDGDSLTMELPFEQFVYERLQDNNDGVVSNLMIATVADSDIEPVNPAPNIHYASTQLSDGKPFAFVDDLGIRATYLTRFNIPSHHFTMNNPIYSTLFEAEFSNWNGVTVQNTLYKRHYEDYITAIFNIKRRTFKYKSVIPISLLTTLQLNDVIKIDNNDYRINKYSYNLLNGVTSFELINGFDNVLGVGNLLPQRIILDNNNHTLIYNLPNAADYTISLEDTGYNIDWLTTSVGVDSITISVDASIIETRNLNIVFTLGLVANKMNVKQIQ